MPEATIRDEIWHQALQKTARRGESVTPDEIAEKVGCAEKTVKNCLLFMSRTGWLRRDVKPNGTVRYLPKEI